MLASIRVGRYQGERPSGFGVMSRRVRFLWAGRGPDPRGGLCRIELRKSTGVLSAVGEKEVGCCIPVDVILEKYVRFVCNSLC